MLVPGVKEWLGKEAELFRDLRNTAEGVLVRRGFEYFYAGIVSKKSIYEENISDLGERFINNCISFRLNGKDIGTIIAPEGTFRVYEYLNRKNKIKGNQGKIFYSQEFLRNESLDEIHDGKTISFWQTGFEIYGYEDIESSTEALKTVVNCFECCEFPNARYRVSDKRILKGLLLNLSLNHQRNIYHLIDKSGEYGNEFIDVYRKNGGEKELAEKIGFLLDLGKERVLTLDILDEYTNNSFSHSGIEFIRLITKKVLLDFPGINLEFIPFMGKSWDACDSLLFDVRLPDYKYAVAGGGNLCAFNSDDRIPKSGAGIGITRLAEYMIERYDKEDFEESNHENNYAM